MAYDKQNTDLYPSMLQHGYQCIHPPPPPNPHTHNINNWVASQVVIIYPKHPQPGSVLDDSVVYFGSQRAWGAWKVVIFGQNFRPGLLICKVPLYPPPPLPMRCVKNVCEKRVRGQATKVKFFTHWFWWYCVENEVVCNRAILRNFHQLIIFFKAYHLPKFSYHYHRPYFPWECYSDK